jgi:hypothetical protein
MIYPTAVAVGLGPMTHVSGKQRGFIHFNAKYV